MTSTCPNPDVLRGVLDSSLPDPVPGRGGRPPGRLLVLPGGARTDRRRRVIQSSTRPGEHGRATARTPPPSGRPSAGSRPRFATRRRPWPSPDPTPASPARAVPNYDFLDPSDDPSHLGRIDRFEMVELRRPRRDGRGPPGLRRLPAADRRGQAARPAVRQERPGPRAVLPRGPRRRRRWPTRTSSPSTTSSAWRRRACRSWSCSSSAASRCRSGSTRAARCRSREAVADRPRRPRPGWPPPTPTA